MKSILFLLTYLTSILLWGQADYEGIRERLFKGGSDSAYLNLLSRFKDSDSTLTTEDFKDLYFGSVFLSSYNPEKISAVEHRIRMHNYAGEFNEAIILADSLLNKYPASIQAYFERGWSYYNLKNLPQEAYNNKRYKVLIRTILNSGNGLSLESSYHSNLMNDEFEVLKYLKLEIKEEKEISYKEERFDIFSLKANKEKVREMYFKVTRQQRR